MPAGRRCEQTLPELNTPQHMALIRRLKHEFDRPEQLAALKTLVEENYSVASFQSVETAKVVFSDHPKATVRLGNADLRPHHLLTRIAFETTAAPRVHAIRGCVELAVSTASLAPDEIDLARTTEGSSRIPAFRRMRSEALPRAGLGESDLFMSIASRLAMSAALQVGGEFS